MELFASPEKYFEEIHQELRKAYVKRNHPFRFVVLSSLGNRYPGSRTVVLRKYFSDHRFWVYTDSRSNKVAELIQNPNATLLFWDAKKKIQIRINVTTEVLHNNEDAEAVWNSLAPKQKEEYLKEEPSGKSIDSPDVFHHHQEEDSRNFTILQFTPKNWDILHLHREGHRRVEVKPSAKGWIPEWIMP
jgi:pyridoxine/pyridoxamine 5'-phosphate oxidase